MYYSGSGSECSESGLKGLGSGSGYEYSRDPDFNARDPDLNARYPDINSREPDVNSRDLDLSVRIRI